MLALVKVILCGALLRFSTVFDKPEHQFCIKLLLLGDIEADTQFQPGESMPVVLT